MSQAQAHPIEKLVAKPALFTDVFREALSLRLLAFMGLALMGFWFSLFVSVTAGAADATVKVLTDRTESNLRPLFNAFEKQTGVKVQAVFLEEGLLERLKSRQGEAEVVITKDAELLESARRLDLLAKMNDGTRKNIESEIPAEFRDSSGDGLRYFVDAYRVRTIIYSKSRVKPGAVSNYEDLGNSKFKGRLCLRSGFHDYNVSLFSQMLSSYGESRTKNLMKAWHENLAREPRGGDRDQAKAIAEGQCDVALLNSYYYPLMKENPEQKSWAEAVEVVYPDQATNGAFIMRSALGLGKSGEKNPSAAKLVEFFASVPAQKIIAGVTYQYPTNQKVEAHEVLKSLGRAKGQFKINFIALDQFADKRNAVVKTLNEVKFDQH
jgi:iron(III) transport system substrate-binding protein